MLISLVTLSSLGALGLLSLLTTRASLQRNALDSNNTCALYAARACVSSSQHALSEAIPPGQGVPAGVWTPFLANENTWVDPSLHPDGEIVGAGLPLGNNASCSVSFRNNPSDGGSGIDGIGGTNTDGLIVVRSVGTCNGATVVLNVTLGSEVPLAGGGYNCDGGYTQANLGADNAGRACNGVGTSTDLTTFDTDSP